MEGEKRKLRFYCSRRKVDSGTQTIFDERATDTEKTLTDHIHDIAINAILEGDFPQVSNIDKALMSGCKSGIGYYDRQQNDERFEILTPPSDLYRDLPVGVNFEFHADKFVILNGDLTKSREYNYDISRWPLVEPLETGKLTAILFSVFDELQVTGFDNGAIICHVIDFRYKPEKMWWLKLTITDEVIRYWANRIQAKPDLAAALEAKSLLKLKPFICTDPSPNVCRVFSELDRVSKMWDPQPPQAKDFHRHVEQKRFVPAAPQFTTACTVKIPQNIMNTVEEMLKIHP